MNHHLDVGPCFVLRSVSSHLINVMSTISQLATFSIFNTGSRSMFFKTTLHFDELASRLRLPLNERRTRRRNNYGQRAVDLVSAV
jgi:hypothetical protein